MKKHLLSIILQSLLAGGSLNAKAQPMKTETPAFPICSDNCMPRNKETSLTCKLTSPELQLRKQTVVANLKQQLTERKELLTGYAFKFTGTDNMLDMLTEFIKTERECCDFLTFNLSISGDKSEIWLELTGPEGAKDFITTELGL